MKINPEISNRLRQQFCVIDGSLAFFSEYAWASYQPSDQTESLKEEAAESVSLVHYNIVFAPDLSNRVNEELHPRPLRDVQIVKSVLNNIYPSILNHRRSDNQLDRFAVSLVNQKLVSEYGAEQAQMQIDFGTFKNQKERIDYIKGRSENSLEEDINTFTRKFERISKKAVQRTFGADVWSYVTT